MQTVLPGLRASAPQALSFAKSLHVQAFLLQREQADLLVYGTAKVADEVLAIADFGGAVRHYLNHWHEADVAGQDALGALGARCSATTQTWQRWPGPTPRPERSPRGIWRVTTSR